jgi:hypothetical protein
MEICIFYKAVFLISFSERRMGVCLNVNLEIRSRIYGLSSFQYAC